jgi:type IV secretory pathway VirB10-like protein
MDKKFNREDILRRLRALVILITIILIYNNFLVSRNHQKEEQIQREKEMVEIRRQKEQERIESTSVDISLEETESIKSYEISVVTDKLSEPVPSVEETEEYKPTADVKWLREHDRSVYTYSYVYPGTRKSSSKTKKRQDYMENLAEEYMEAEGLDYDSAYEAAEED